MEFSLSALDMRCSTRHFCITYNLCLFIKLYLARLPGGFLCALLCLYQAALLEFLPGSSGSLVQGMGQASLIPGESGAYPKRDEIKDRIAFMVRLGKGRESLKPFA